MRRLTILVLLAVVWAFQAKAQMTEKWLTAETTATNNDYGADIAKDASGNSFVVAKRHNGSNYDIYLIKYNSSGVKQWARTFDGGADDYPIGVLLDASNNIYIGGNSVVSGVNKLKALMYNSAGTLQWQYVSPAAYETRVQTMDLYNNTLHLGGYEVISTSNTNAIFVKLSSTGTLAWSQSYDNVSVDKTNDIKVRTTNGDVYATGSTGTDFFTIRFNTSGVQQWVRTYVGGKGNAIAIGGALAAFAVYVAGNYADDAIILKYNEAGTIQWNRSVNGMASVNYSANNIEFYSANLYIGVASNNIDYPSKVLKYNAAGTVQWTYTSEAVYGAPLLVNSTSVYAMYGNTIDKINISTGAKEAGYNLPDFHQDIESLQSQLYSFVQGDNNDVLVTGCFKEEGDTYKRIAIIDLCVPLVDVVLTSPSSYNQCEDTYLNAVASGSAGAYQWYFASNVIDVAPITTIVNSALSSTQVVVTSTAQEWHNLYLIIKGYDANSCPDYDSTQLYVQPLPYLTSHNIQNEGPLGVCAGGYVEFSTVSYFEMADWYVDGAFITTTTSGQSITATIPGDYYAIVWNTQGCSDTTESVTMYTIASAPVLDLGSDFNSCVGYEEDLNSNIEGYYLWSTGETTHAIETTGLGVFAVTVTVPGCTPQIDQIEILNRLPNPKPNLGPDQTVCSGLGANLDAGAGFVSYLWSDGNTNQAHTVYTSGTYRVKATSINGCFNRDTVVISTIPSPEVTLTSDQSICSGSSVSLSASNALVRTDYFNFFEDRTSHGYITSGNVSYQGAHICSEDTNIVVGYDSGSTGYVEITVDVTPGVSEIKMNLLTKWNNGGTADISIDGINFYGTAITTGCTANNLTFSGLSSVTSDGEVVIRFADNNTTAYNGRLYLNSVEILSVSSSGTRQWSSIPSGYTSTSQTISVSPTVTTDYIYSYSDGTCSSYDTVTVRVMRANLGADFNVCSGSTVLDAGSGFSSYLWSTGATTQTINVTTAGTYSVSVTHASCSASNDAVVVSFNSGSTVNLGADISACSGSSVTLNAGFTGTYLWSTGATTQTITVSVDGVYSVTATNSQGCESTDNISVAFYAPPVVELGSNITTCEGQTVLFDAGAGSSYLWSNSATTQTISPTTSGTYNVTVTGTGSCTTTDAITVTFNARPVLELGADIVACNGQVVTVSAGTASSYLWSTGATTASLGVTNDGTYSVTVTGANGCTNTDALFADFHSVPSLDLGSDITVCGNPAVSVSATAGNTYNWSSGQTTQDIYPTTSGTYTVTVTNSENCTATDAIVVTFNPLPAINLGSDISVCSGTPVTLNAGTASSYLWNNAATTSTISVSSGGMYSVTITSSAGCINSDNINVDFLSLPPVNLGSDITVCAGNAVTLDAGTGVSYIWSNATTLQTLSPTASGTYSVTVTGSNTCTASDAIVVTINPTPTVNLGADLTRCLGQSVTLNAGTASAYNWSTGATTQNITVSSTGTYTVTVQNSYSCTNTDNIAVTFNPSPSVNLGSDVTVCSGTAVTLNAGTATSYTWSTGVSTQTISPTSSGTYTVTVSNTYSCTASDAVVVTVNPLPSVNLGADLTRCEGQTVTLNAGTASSYIWSTSATTQTINVTSTGLYTVTVQNSYGCSGTDNVNVTFNALPVVNLGADQTVCAGTSVTLDAGSGLSYLWSNGATNQTITTGVSGTYTVTVTQNGCQNTDQAIVTVNALPVVNLGPDFSSCTGSTVVLNAGVGANSYLWSTGATSQTINVTGNGTYSVTVTSNSCTATDNVTATFQSSLSVDLGSDISACTGETVMVNAGSGFDSYLWSNGATTSAIPATQTGNYSVTVTSGACPSVSDNINVSFDALPSIELGSNLSACAQLQLQAGSGFTTYLWSTTQATENITIVSSGNYSVIVTDANGCSNSDNVDVTIFANPVADLGSDLSGCTSVLVQDLSGISGLTYLWSNSATDSEISVSSNGNYSVTITDSNGCTDNDDVNVVVYELFTLDSTIVNANCGNNDGSATVVVSGGTPSYTYYWSTGGTTGTISGVAAGSYTVSVSDGNTCVNSLTVTVGNTNAPVLTMSEIPVSCYGLCNGTASVSVSGGDAPYDYEWSNSTYNENNTSVCSGVYSVTITDNNNCVVIETVEVTQPEELAIAYITTGDSTNTVSIQEGSITLTITGGTQPYTYLWEGGETTSLLENLMPGFYTVTVTDQNNCSQSAVIEIEGIITSIMSVESPISVQVYPNPTVDGLVYIKSNMPIIKVEIYNVLGEKVATFINAEDILDISNLSKGLYFARMYFESKQTKDYKLIKE